jgi:CheY-like chemotaxis protein
MATVLIVDDSPVDRKLIGGLLNRDSDWTIEYAENGAKALARMQIVDVDVIVTDLNMPEMDGLDLVRAVRVQYPDLPVILITGQGSESLAIEALEQGAASYVPKQRLAEMLSETLDQVLGMVRADRSYARLIECVDRTEFTFTLRNDPALIDPLVDMVQQMVGGMRLCDAIWRVRVGIALEQALLNALYRGNLEISPEQMLEAREALLKGEGGDLISQRSSQAPYSERTIHVDIAITKDEARFLVRDQGPGFDVASAPAPGDAGALEREGGRGLVLMRTFMDEVTFNDKGNEVTMIKRRDE